jgi:hypothetical protein
MIDALRAFLSANFPGATIDDDYYFVSVRSPANRRIKRDGVAAVAQKICDGWCWLVGVNVDGVAELAPLESESRPITYQPDWNIQQRFTQQLARVPCPIDIDRLRRSKTDPSALVLISPSQRIVFDLAYDRVYAPSAEVLSTFLSGLDRYVDSTS